MQRVNSDSAGRYGVRQLYAGVAWRASIPVNRQTFIHDPSTVNHCVHGRHTLFDARPISVHVYCGAHTRPRLSPTNEGESTRPVVRRNAVRVRVARYVGGAQMKK